MQTEMAETHQQDQSAVAAVRGGDAERYRELVERHERRVYAVAWSRLGDAALAEEVTQEAFIRAYRRLWLLGDGAKFSGWIATIARRMAINFGLRHRRELNKRERWALEHYSEASPGKSPEENEPLHSPETLRQTLAELPDAYRECLVLFYLEGKSGTEAAAALGVSDSALRVRLHRARAALRERLEEKLEGSLERLRPSKALVPAIMAGVLASSTAKAAATGGTGAVIASVLGKTGIGKWLLPFGSLFSFILVLPMLLATWLMAQMELKNFRDAKGFRAQLFKSQIKNRVFLVVVCIIIGLIIIPVIGRLVDRGLFAGAKPEAIFLVITGFMLTFLPFSLRLVAINHNPFFLASIGSSLTIGTACMLAGLNLLPPSNVNLFIIGQALVFLPFFHHRPVRMDYNLFLRAAEGLLPVPDVEPAGIARSKADLLAFARFLGTRWMANNYRWSDKGLTLRLPPANFSQWSGWTDTAFNWSLRQRSWICLGWDGSVTGQLGEKDRRSLAKLRQDEIFPKCGWEAQVAAAVSAAWNKFDADDFDGAERALGQVAESEVFVVSPAKGGFGRLRWLTAILLGIILFASLGINLPGCRAQLERLNGLKPVNLTETQVRQFMSLVSTNPNPLIEKVVNGHKGYTRQ
jgi:RNA polymerase sigma factor (sigma-70 family)